MESIILNWNPLPDIQIRARWSIFITIGVCAGLPALVWSVSDIIQHRRNGHRISAFIIPLLLTDCIESFLSPYILIKLLLNELNWDGGWTCRVSLVVWSSSRVCGLLLNQLVVLEGNLTVIYPLDTAHIFSSNIFISFYIFLFLCFILVCMLHNIPLALLLLIVSVILWILSCFALCCSDRQSHTSQKKDPHIWVVFIFNVLVLYLPLILLRFLLLIYQYVPLPLHVWLIPCFLMSMRLISDPLLCVLVCRQNLSVQTAQNPTKLV